MTGGVYRSPELLYMPKALVPITRLGTPIQVILRRFLRVLSRVPIVVRSDLRRCPRSRSKGERVEDVVVIVDLDNDGVLRRRRFARR